VIGFPAGAARQRLAGARHSRCTISRRCHSRSEILGAGAPQGCTVLPLMRLANCARSARQCGWRTTVSTRLTPQWGSVRGGDLTSGSSGTCRVYFSGTTWGSSRSLPTSAAESYCIVSCCPRGNRAVLHISMGTFFPSLNCTIRWPCRACCARSAPNWRWNRNSSAQR